jgi:hypothetical protein
MKYDSWAHSWSAPLQALALVATSRVGLIRSSFGKCFWVEFNNAKMTHLKIDIQVHEMKDHETD